MKAILYALVAVLLVAVMLPASAPAQSNQTPLPKMLMYQKAYANSQVNICNTCWVGQYARLGLTFSALDSVVVTIAVDTRPWGGTTWTPLDSLTITSTADAGVTQEYILRNQVLDKASAGVMCATRVRCSFAGSGNGVTSATYSLRLDGR